MTTKQIFCALAVAALVLVASSLASLSPADAPAGTTPNAVLVAATPAPSSPIEAAGGVALAAGAVAAAMAERRRFGSAEFLGATAKVWKAIEATLRVVPGYFEGHLAGRSAAGDGSTVWRWGKPCPDATAVLNTILDTGWFEAPEVPNLLPGCKAFKAAIPGTVDLRQVSNLTDDTPVVWVKTDHGYQYPTVPGVAGEYVHDTILIVGPEAGTEVVYTFHPGLPIRPSQISADVDTAGIDTIAALKTAYPQIEWVKVAHTA